MTNTDARLASIVMGHVRKGRTAPLYHASTPHSAGKILLTNRLQGNTATHPKEPGEFQRPGVSLTRDRRFAEYWGSVIFVLDQDKLSRRYRITPRDYFYQNEANDLLHRQESEEFVPGSIDNLDTYLTGIYFDTITFDAIQVMGRSGRPVLPLGLLKVILDHPKFSPWQLEQLPFRLVYGGDGEVVMEEKYHTRPKSPTLDESIPF